MEMVRRSHDLRMGEWRAKATFLSFDFRREGMNMFGDQGEESKGTVMGFILFYFITLY